MTAVEERLKMSPRVIFRNLDFRPPWEAVLVGTSACAARGCRTAGDGGDGQRGDRWVKVTEAACRAQRVLEFFHFVTWEFLNTRVRKELPG